MIRVSEGNQLLLSPGGGGGVLRRRRGVELWGFEEGEGLGEGLRGWRRVVGFRVGDAVAASASANSEDFFVGWDLNDALPSLLLSAFFSFSLCFFCVFHFWIWIWISRPPPTSFTFCRQAMKLGRTKQKSLSPAQSPFEFGIF